MLLSVFHLVYILNIYSGKPPVNVDDNGNCNGCSAAATAITKRLKKWPSSFPGKRYLLKAMKLIFTELSISSTDISIVIRFLLVRKAVNSGEEHYRGQDEVKLKWYS
jgi:hypothetical protein